MQRSSKLNRAEAHPWLLAVFVTVAVGLLARAAPDAWNATAVGLVFLGTTYWATISGKTSAHVRATGLSLAGLLETEPLDVNRWLRASAKACLLALLASVLIFPAFWLGFVIWWHPTHPFAFSSPASWGDELFGQALVIALPEEAFYRGFLLTNLARADQRRVPVLGVLLGMSLVWSSALFAVGHFVTEPNLSRLAVFFPALVFGWLRLRTGGIGASLLFHVACNAFASLLGRGYGLWS
jgi:membrane protease YdiL (CAAX protease family)